MKEKWIKKNAHCSKLLRHSGEEVRGGVGNIISQGLALNLRSGNSGGTKLSLARAVVSLHESHLRLLFQALLGLLSQRDARQLPAHCS